MRENENRIDEEHRKELLRFLLVKTAAVRQGVKPAELLRVRHCYASVNAEGLRVCLYRSDIYGILGLDYVELKVEAESSLVLFYNPSTLATTLSERRNARWLARMGYPSTATADGHLSSMLAHLVRRAGGLRHPDRAGDRRLACGRAWRPAARRRHRPRRSDALRAIALRLNHLTACAAK